MFVKYFAIRNIKIINYQMIYKLNLKAITLIEVLISIAIFSIGILSISYLIINNVWLSERTKLKTTATMLAKEWIELVYNRRDTNIKKWRLWNCLALKQGSYAGECETFFHDPNNLNTSTSRTIQIDENGSYGFNSIGSALDNDKLYPVKSSFWNYTILESRWAKNNIIGQKTSQFRRRITFSPVILWPEWWASQADKLLKVTSTVLYKKSAYSGSVTLQSFIGDTLDTIPLDYYK